QRRDDDAGHALVLGLPGKALAGADGGQRVQGRGHSEPERGQRRHGGPLADCVLRAGLGERLLHTVASLCHGRDVRGHREHDPLRRRVPGELHRGGGGLCPVLHLVQRRPLLRALRHGSGLDRHAAPLGHRPAARVRRDLRLRLRRAQAGRRAQEQACARGCPDVGAGDVAADDGPARLRRATDGGAARSRRASCGGASADPDAGHLPGEPGARRPARRTGPRRAAVAGDRASRRGPGHAFPGAGV
ncbi:unnamed protein product, partial [Prorocentrum cordatum]